MPNQFLTPEYIEGKRREIMDQDVQQSDADRHIAGFISSQTGTGSAFTRDFDYIQTKNPNAISSLLDFYAYGTTQPTGRFAIPEPEEDALGFGEGFGGVLETISVGSLGRSLATVPKRAALSFAEPETIEREKEELSIGFDVKDLPGDIADVLGRALPTVGFLLGGVAGATFGGVGAIPGAAIGAGTGEAARRLVGEAIGVREPEPLETLKAVGTEAVIGAATEVTGLGASKAIGALGKTKAVQNTLKFLQEKLPERTINSTLKPLSKEFSFGKNPGKAVVDEGIVANTRAGLLSKIVGRKKEVGQSLDDTIGAFSKGAKKVQVDMTDLINKPIKEAQLAAKKRGETKLFEALEDLRVGLTRDFIEKGGKLVPGKEKGLIVTPLGLWDEKKSIGDGIRWTGQAFDNDLNKVKFKIFSNLKNALTNVVPTSKKLLSRYANLVGAENSALRQIAIQERQNIVKFGQTTLGGVVGVGSLATGDQPAEAVLKGATAALLLRVLGGTGTKTATAQALRQLPKVVKAALTKLTPIEKAAIFNIIQPQTQEATEE